MSEEKYSFQRTYTLLPQSPLIHFQYNQNGAALRATEVKPKLDRYIIKRYIKQYGKPVPGKWRNKQSPTALNYKLQINAAEKTEPLKLGRKTDYAIYFANMNEKKEKNKNTQKRGIYAKMSLTVTCFISELLDYIIEIIGDFFVVSNFGAMQDKGFGSYLVDEEDDKKEYKPEQIASLLKDEYGCKAVYYFSVKGNGTKGNSSNGKTEKEIEEENQKSIQKNLFNNIKVLHNTLKAGNAFSPKTQSLLYKYFREKVDPSLKSEKEWLKKNAKLSKSAYIRALMGVSDHMGTVEKPVDIEGKEGIERVPSPIWFVIVKNNVYFIGRRIPENLYGAEFMFSSESADYNSGKLKVPDKTVIGENFIDKYLAYAVRQLKDMYINRKFRFKVKEVK